MVEREFLDFLDYVKILEPPPGGGIIKFQKWDHILEMVEALRLYRLDVIVKSRQLGLSWLLAAYALWTVLYHEAAVVFMFSQGETEAKIFLGKSRFIHEHLPSHLQGRLGTDSTTEIHFPGMHSKIVAWPSTENAGRSETATLVLVDEAERHNHLDDNYASVKPTTDAGGQLVYVSTVKKNKPNSLFKELVRDVANSFHKIFFGWRVRPGRDDEWYAQTKRDAPTTETMSPELYMEQEHPENLEEAMAPSRVMAAFDPDALTAMETETRDTIQTIGPINIYQKFVAGHRYAAASDPSHGVGKDDAVTIVIDLATGAGVADIRDSTLPPARLAFHSVSLLKMYNEPIWAIEDNDWGNTVIEKAHDMEYSNLYERGPGKFGWHTGNHNRYMVWGELIEAVEARTVVVYSKSGLAQFRNVIRNPEKEGRVEGMERTRDDYPMAFGIAWQMRKHAYDTHIVRPYKIE